MVNVSTNERFARAVSPPFTPRAMVRFSQLFFRTTTKQNKPQRHLPNDRFHHKTTKPTAPTMTQTKDFILVDRPDERVAATEQDPLLLYADASSPAHEDPAANGSSSESPEATTTTTTIEPTIDILQYVPDDQRHLVGPAGVGGAVLGMVVGGPILSALVGCGSAYAVRKDGTPGDVARTIGEATLSLQTKVEGYEAKHGYCKKVQTSVREYCDEQPPHSLVAKTRAMAVCSWSAAINYIRKHQIIERGVEGTGYGIEYIANLFSSSSSEKIPQQQEPAPAAVAASVY